MHPDNSHDHGASCRFECDICGIRLSREAHLKRHKQVHLRNTHPVTEHPCSVCGKVFLRKDVLLRHERMIHMQSSNESARGRKTACDHCVRLKLRCSRTCPCDSCSYRGLQCVFTWASAPQGRKSGASQTASKQPLPHLRVPAGSTSAEPDTSLSTEHTSTGIQRQSPAPFINYAEADETTGPDGHGQQYLDEQSRSIGYPPQPDVLPATGNPDARPAGDNYDYSMLPMNSSMPQRLTQFDSRSVDWTMQPYDRDNALDTQLDNFDWDTLPPWGTDWLDADFTTLFPQSLGGKVHEYDSAAGASVFKSLVVESSAPKSGAPPSTQRMADYSPAADTIPSPNELPQPPSESAMQSIVSDSPHLTLNALNETSIAQALRTALKGPRVLLDSTSASNTVAILRLEGLVNVYFSKFHANMPIIHKPTWNIMTTHSCVVAAMACLGSTSDNRVQGHDDTSKLLEEVTMKHLNAMYHRGPTEYQNADFVSASILQQVYCLGVAIPSLHETADNVRAIDAMILRKTGAYRSVNKSDVSSVEVPDIAQIDLAQSDEVLEALWMRWRRAELAKRLAWCLFEYDNTLATLTNKRSVTSLQELPDTLPCDESLWDASTARSWASVAFLTSHPLRGLSFRPLLRQLSNGIHMEDQSSGWWKRCLAQAIGRLLSDLKEVEDSVANLYAMDLRLESPTGRRKALLDSLALLRDSARRPARPEELVHTNITCLISHHANLNIQREIMEMFVFVYQTGIDAQEIELNAVRARLRSLFASNRNQARQLLYHAASVIAISRHCTCYTPCETLRVFDSYAFILAFVKFGATTNGTVNDGPPGPGDCGDGHGDHQETCLDEEHHQSTLSRVETVRLDLVPWSRPRHEDEALSLWLTRNQGRASIDGVDIVHDEHVLQKLRSSALRSLKALSLWSLSRNFYRVFENFN